MLDLATASLFFFFFFVVAAPAERHDDRRHALELPMCPHSGQLKREAKMAKAVANDSIIGWQFIIRKQMTGVSWKPPSFCVSLCSSAGGAHRQSFDSNE